MGCLPTTNQQSQIAPKPKQTQKAKADNPQNEQVVHISQQMQIQMQIRQTNNKIQIIDSKSRVNETVKNHQPEDHEQQIVQIEHSEDKDSWAQLAILMNQIGPSQQYLIQAIVKSINNDQNDSGRVSSLYIQLANSKVKQCKDKYNQLHKSMHANNSSNINQYNKQKEIKTDAIKLKQYTKSVYQLMWLADNLKLTNRVDNNISRVDRNMNINRNINRAEGVKAMKSWLKIRKIVYRMSKLQL